VSRELQRSPRPGLSLTGLVALAIIVIIIGVGLLYAYRAYFTP
jgi:hypothetical protein